MVDFLIIGTPKAGTTAIQSYLSQHSKIFMPVQKEVHFFGEEFKNEIAAKNIYYNDYKLEDYNRLFDEADESDIKGEASVFYLYSTSAPKEIKEYNPKMKIIVCFRNPVDFLISYHQDSIYVENETERDFWKALALESQRKKGNCIPSTNNLRMSLYYSELVDYSRFLKTYKDLFGNENVHVIIFEEFFSKPEVAFKEIIKFLGVKTEPDTSIFKKVNPRRNIKFKFLNTLIRRPGKIIRKTARILVPNQKMRLKTYNLIRKFNTSHKIVNDLSIEEKVSLYSKLEKHILSFEKLLGRDIPDWKKYKN